MKIDEGKVHPVGMAKVQQWFIRIILGYDPVLEKRDLGESRGTQVFCISEKFGFGRLLILVNIPESTVP